MLLLGVLVASALTALPCAEVKPDLESERGVAGVYLDIAREERAAGRRASAQVAYREALRRDPGLQEARRGLEAVCSDDEALEEAIEQMKAGRCEAGLRVLDEKASSTEPSPQRLEPGTQLLEGLCRFELGQDARAEASFVAASADPSLRDVTNLYRGLIAQRSARNEEARRWFEAASSSSDSRLRRAAEALSLEAGKEKGYALFVLLEAGSDSNVSLLPDGTPAALSPADAFAGASALLSAFPLGSQWPGLQLGGQIRKQVSFSEFDVGLVSAGLRWQPRFTDVQPRIELSQVLVTLGFAPYLWSQELQVGIRRWEGRAWIDVSYGLGLDSYRSSFLDAYSGFRHGGAFSVAWPFGRSVRMRADYGLRRTLAKEAALSYLEHGPALGARWTVGESFVLDGQVGPSWRRYDVVSTEFLTPQRQTLVDGTLQAEWMLTPAVSLLGSLSARRSLSFEETFSYRRWVASFGVSHAAAFP